MGLFRKIDKTNENWRDERSPFWNWLCLEGAKVGEIGKNAGPIILEAGKDALVFAIEIFMPKAFEKVTQMISKFTPKGIAFAQGLIKEMDKLDIPGVDKMLNVFDEMKEFLKSIGKELTTTQTKTWLQDIFYDMRESGDI